MGRRLLTLWHIGLIGFVIQLVIYSIIVYGISGIHNKTWDIFNEQALVISDVDTTVPYGEIINRHARQNGINGQIVASLIQAESSFQPRARSPAGAYGLMQITPDTWRYVNKQHRICDNRHLGECTVECYYNAELNVAIGTIYLSQMIKKYEGNMVLALAAYNAGPGAVDKYKDIPPYDETVTYVNRVIDYWYKLSSYAMPYTIFTAGQWSNIRAAIGWCSMITLFGLLCIVRGLHRYYHSWRWR
ncbi:MAG: Lytic transglycosylase catalytic [Pelosinus sp.]|nr:Lytic transglycosylase catalytic [Pelosinus sp.]